MLSQNFFNDSGAFETVIYNTIAFKNDTWMEAGIKVDILMTHCFDGKETKSSFKTLEKNIEVLKVSDQKKDENSFFRQVKLLVPKSSLENINIISKHPEQIQLLISDDNNWEDEVKKIFARDNGVAFIGGKLNEIAMNDQKMVKE